jgi:exonuclease SbcC
VSMRLTYVEIENIKSYAQPTRIHFTPGLNAVCGHNGSGKSTVLEAIGFALFNFIPYSQQGFLREGARGGSISVGFVARDDREYLIVRKIGANNQYYVCDAETGSRLAERREEVQTWIRQEALNVEPGTELDALFRNAVGVPQGLMTAGFQETPSTRKSIFDPLLRVEEYRNAWEHLLGAMNYLRDRTENLNVEIARLEVETGKIPETKQRAANLLSLHEESNTQLEELESELNRLLSMKIELDRVEASLDALHKAKLEAEYNVTRCRDLRQMHRDALRQSEEAERIVHETRERYELVVRARGALGALEDQRRERDGLEQARANAHGDRQGVIGTIQQLDEGLRRALESASEADQLADSLIVQEGLEREIAAKDIEVADAPRVETQIGGLRGELDRVEQRLIERETRIGTAQKARTASVELAGFQTKLTAATSQLAGFESTRQQAKAIEQRGVQLRERCERLKEESSQARKLRETLADLEAMAAPLEDLLGTERELQEQRTRAAAAIDYEKVARAGLERHHCRLLEIDCPVVVAQPALLERFDVRAAELTGQSRDLDVRLESMKAEIRAAKEAADSVQELRVHAAGLARSADDLEQVERELQGMREEYVVLAAKLEEEPELKRREHELHGTVERLQREAQLAAQLPLLEIQQSEDRAAIALHNTELADLLERQTTLTAIRDQVEILRGRLAELDDPRTRRERLLAFAQERISIEAKIAIARGQLAEADGKIQVLAEQLAPFDSLDSEVAEHRRIDAEHHAEYERFLNHNEAASALVQRREAFENAASVLDDAEKALAGVRAEEEASAQVYDAEEHRKLKDECSAMSGEVRVERSKLERCESDLRDVKRELDDLMRHEHKRIDEVAARNELGRVAEEIRFIRETIQAAGPMVTETLLRNISYAANEIYAEIMDDHAAELRWDRDYEVLVQRGPETRTFGQLSGGEQMSAALALRLALLKEMSEVDFAFFDEPTQNMDSDRRTNLAEQIRQVRGFEQLIVISHDDTFEHHTDNLIRLTKTHEETHAEVG